MGRKLNGPEKYGIVDKLKLLNCGEPAQLLIAAQQLSALELVTVRYLCGTVAAGEHGISRTRELALWNAKFWKCAAN